MTAAIFTFPNSAGKQAIMAALRGHFSQQGWSQDFSDFVVERVGQVFDFYDCGKPLSVSRQDGEDQGQAERIALELEKQVSAIISGLLTELAITYALIWELEGGE